MTRFASFGLAVAVLLGTIGIGNDAEAAKRWTPTKKSTYVLPETREGPPELFVGDVDDGKGRMREVDPDISCKVDMHVAQTAWQKAVSEDTKCRVRRDRYKEIHVGNDTVLEHAQNMCPTPMYAPPLCEQCADSQPCKSRMSRVKLWRKCRFEMIQEGEYAGLDPVAIDRSIQDACGPQIKVDSAFALLPEGAKKVLVSKPLRNRPGASSTPKVPQVLRAVPSQTQSGAGVKPTAKVATTRK